MTASLSDWQFQNISENMKVFVVLCVYILYRKISG